MRQRQFLASVLVSLMLLGSAVPTLPAQARTYYGYSNYRDRHPIRSYFYRHPYQKKMAIGGSIGAVAGGLLAGEGAHGRGLARGAILGAGAGAGYEFLKRKGVF